MQNRRKLYFKYHFFITLDYEYFNLPSLDRMLDDFVSLMQVFVRLFSLFTMWTVIFIKVSIDGISLRWLFVQVNSSCEHPPGPPDTPWYNQHNKQIRPNHFLCEHSVNTNNNLNTKASTLISIQDQLATSTSSFTNPPQQYEILFLHLIQQTFSISLVHLLQLY